MTATLTESDINALHTQEHAEAAQTYGRFGIPWPTAQELGERTRQRWVRFVSERDGTTGDSIIRHDKTDKLAAYVKNNPGLLVTAETMAEAAECSRGTVHKFIGDNRSAFTNVARGQYMIVDTKAARAADRQAPNVPAPFVPCEPKWAGAVDQAKRESDIATNALNGMTGQTSSFRGQVGKA